MIITKTEGIVTIYIVDKDYDDSKLQDIMNTKLNEIQSIIDDDADVYTVDGKLLLRFRKNKLTRETIDNFYDNIINFAKIPTNNRGSACGSKNKNVYSNPKIMTNIIGFFDNLSPKQKYRLKQEGITLKTDVRQCRFNTDYPEKYKKLLPLIYQIDEFYKEYIPANYQSQREKANETPFRIEKTAFTTITTNVNFQTAVHTDKGDDIDGFGNLSVIEYGKYKGGETCFPQYGIGVNVRTGDILYMDVHQAHGNLPIELETEDSIRLSIVCYLRKNIWEKTKGQTTNFMQKHIEMMNSFRKH
jgi:hypothetical protein